jgi:hypothetical protein
VFESVVNKEFPSSDLKAPGSSQPSSRPEVVSIRRLRGKEEL